MAGTSPATTMHGHDDTVHVDGGSKL